MSGSGARTSHLQGLRQAMRALEPSTGLEEVPRQSDVQGRKEVKVRSQAIWD